MQSTLVVIAVVAAACAGPSKSAPPPAPEVPPPHQEPASPTVPIPPLAPVAVNADPDLPSGADAARDAELAKAASAAIDAFVNSRPQFTRDGKRVVFVSDRDGLPQLYIADATRPDAPATRLDLATGAATPLWPTDGTKVTIFSEAFSADGKRVLIATDGGGEQALLLSIDAATGTETARYVETKPATAEIEGFTVAKVGNTVAATVNAGNHHEVRILDATTLKPKATVSLPLGSGGTGRFSEDGKGFTMTWSTPSSPFDIYAVEVATGKVTPLRKEPRPQLAGLPPVEASIARVEGFDHTKIPVNVFLPSGAKDKKLPVIVSYHGGPSGSSPESRSSSLPRVVHHATPRSVASRFSRVGSRDNGPQRLRRKGEFRWPVMRPLS